MLLTELIVMEVQHFNILQYNEVSRHAFKSLYQSQVKFEEKKKVVLTAIKIKVLEKQ